METVLRVISLNLYHGRGKSPSYVLKPFTSRKKVRENLKQIAGLIEKEKPQVVLIQEAERYSLLCGRFDHLSELSEISGYPYFSSGEERELGPGKNLFIYGTAIMSRYHIDESFSYYFFNKVPFSGKGFTKGTVHMPGFHHAIDFVSAHLASLHAFPTKARRKNAYSLVETISREVPKNTLVVGGDFNCEWGSDDILKGICGALEVIPYNPNQSGLETFPSRDPRKRIDWIFASPGLEFKDYKVLEERVSDHRAVMAVFEERK